MQIKSCELDYLPTHILKDNMESFIPILTKIVNLSLESGVFSEDWKAAVFETIIEKSGLDLIQIIGLLVISLLFPNWWRELL